MIIPALLTSERQELIEMVNLCANFTNYVQIDIMDGKFVPSTSVEVKDLDGWESSIGCEAHLMVNDPLIWIEPFKKIGAKRILYHFEIEGDHAQIIEKIKEAGLEAGIVVNPQTKIDQFKHLIDKIDMVLFMSVNPGFYGAPFIPEVLEKIREFKQCYPDKQTEIDGGVKLDNLLTVKASGVDHICVGSAILKAGSPKEAFESFTKLLNE
jgi:ribulose-phosphate 3-epimerase